ncbi:SRPBCC family protein [Ilumatobacter sp.]|uniref:SRPBCC family protein n=1 Tax=Ilumatobacter sp. TaxID=1967498 RepID=UPI003B51A546
MAEQLVNEFTVNRPIEEAWPIITDVEKIAPCLPGAELQEIAQDDERGEVYRGVVKVKLGAISTQFKGDAHFVEKDDENYRATIKGKGRDTGGRGNASADIAANAESLSPTSTKVTVTTDLHITGKVAQFGRGILGDVSSKLIDQFSANLNQMIDEDGVGTPAPDADPDGGASESEAPADAGSAGSPAADAGGAATATEGSSTAATTGGSALDGTASTPATGGDEASKVRKINGPAADPIDLMGVSGSSILKRAAPVLGALALVLLVLRRRRS